MFLLPSLALGLVFAVLLGGKPSRLLDVQFRLSWTVPAALALQAALFFAPDLRIDSELQSWLHLASYGLLVVFAAANARIWALVPVLVGVGLNALVIAVNGGRMPVWGSAADTVDLQAGSHSNVARTDDGSRLQFLGDIFALPAELPLTNVFSVGDLLIGFGMASFIVFVSLDGSRSRALSPGRLFEPLRTRSYRYLAAGRFISHLGDWLTLAALIGWVYEATGSTAHVAALLIVRLAPPIIGGGIAALLVDRLSKHRMLVWVEASRGLAVAGALVGVVTGEHVFIYVALTCSGALAAMSSAAVPALVPSLLPAEQLPSANAGLGIAKDAAMALGALGAGLSLSTVGTMWALILDLGTFAAAMVLFSRLRVGGAGVAAAAETSAGEGLLTGLRYLLSRRRLVLLLFAFGAATLATGLTNATLPHFLGQQLGFGPGGYGFGLAALATGLLLGEALVGFTSAGPSAGRWIGAGLLVMASLLWLLGLVDHAPTALLILGAIGFVDGTTDVLFDTVVQREADPRYYGCVFGFASAFMMATMTGAFAVAPLANRLFDPKDVFLGAGAFLVAAGVIALVGMRRPPDPFHEPEVPALAPANGSRHARIRRKGEDVSVITWEALVPAALDAARELEEEFSVEIVALQALGAWDRPEVLRSVRKTSKAIVLHNGGPDRQLAAEIAAAIAEEAFQDLDAPVRRVSAPGHDVGEELRDLAEF